MTVAPRVLQSRCPTRRVRLVLLGLLVLFVAVAKVQADVSTVADPNVDESTAAALDVAKDAALVNASASSPSVTLDDYEAQLRTMTDEHLKKTLMDRSAGKKINWKAYATTDAIIEALVAADRKEARRKAFLVRVDKALEKQAKAPLRDNTHTVTIVYCADTGYAADVQRYESALFEEKAAMRKAKALAKVKKAKKAKEKHQKRTAVSEDERVEEVTPQTVTFTQLERSLFLPNADSVVFTSEAFPLPRANQIKFQITFALFIAMVALSVFVGQLTFLPASVRTYLTNHRTLLVSTAMMFNMISSTVRRTGAFEVYVDGSLVYSHLAHGGTSTALPSVSFLSELLINATLLQPYGV